MVAVRVTDSNADPEAKESYSLAISATNDLPTLPRGTWKQFFLQLMTSSLCLPDGLAKGYSICLAPNEVGVCHWLEDG